jgi:DNA-directed RNA polymerase subunit RPC12/RpoP
MEDFLEAYLINDQPVTCPKCGSRTDFKETLDDENKEVVQNHQCPDTSCRYKFEVVES